MSSLFAKIFLWFWLAITIIIAALALVAWVYPYSVAPGGMLPDHLHELQVRGVIATLELRGKEAFESHRRELESASRLRTYYLDEAGNELSGQRVPQSLLSFANEHQEEIDAGERVMVGQPSRLAIPMTDSQGRKYLALVEGGRQAFGRWRDAERNRSMTPGSGAGSTMNTRPGERTGRSGGIDGEPRRDRTGSQGGGEAGSGAPSPRQPSSAGSRESGRGGSGGPGGGGGGPRPVEAMPRFELIVPPHVLLLRLLAVVLAAGLGCYMLARYLTFPVRQLQQAARRMAAGDFTTRVGKGLASRRDEIGELGREFDRMAGQVDALLTTQRRLLRDVSHELRSPLARLNVALELASRDAGDKAGPALARVGLEAERLNELIGQLLALARLESGAVQSEHVAISLHDLVSEVAADADFEAGAHDRSVRVNRCDECSIEGDSNLLRSAVENVVRNAARHTNQGSEVEVSLRCDEHDGQQLAVIEIRDHGPGVPEEALESIFEPFFRVSDARERQGGAGGVGLGLAITRRAVNLHAGSVVALNANDGGLIVRIILPCTRRA